jgi:hypothetical protein
VLAVIRQAAAILMGDRTHAMTPPEFTGALAAQAPDVGPADLERLARLLDWHEARTYAGLAPPPPQLPDVTRVVGAIQAAAVAAVRGRVIHGRTEVPA